MKKLVVKLEIHGDKQKKKAMKLVTEVSGIDSVVVDMKEKKMTVVGDVDPVKVIKQLRKSCCAELLTVEPAKEENKNGGKKKEGNNNEKKDDEKKDGDKKKEGNNEKKKDGNNKKSETEQIAEVDKGNKGYNNPSICYNQSTEENPNACVIL